MSTIVWDKPIERKFETGVEKGVLYVGNQAGVPWNGLVSVEENHTGGEVVARYQDGVKTHNHAPPQEYETTITAYTYPDEFEECLGLYEAHDGVFLDEQQRVPFGMTYQTRIGDSLVGDRRGYKIHLIYNAIATPNNVVRNTISDIPELTEFSWTVQTAPADAPGFRPTSHFILEPSRIGPLLFQNLEARLYGGRGYTPRLLSPRQILDVVGEWRILYPSPNTFPSLDTLPGGP